MAHGENLEYLAFKKSMTVLTDNICHGIDQISGKVFSANLINESNKCLNTDLSEQIRTKALMNALLGRMKSMPETFSTFTQILKDTGGVDFIGGILDDNLAELEAKREMVVGTADPTLANVRNGALAGSGVDISSIREFDEDSEIPAFRTPFQGSSDIGCLVGVRPCPRGRRVLTPPPVCKDTKQLKFKKSRSRSLTPPPNNKPSERMTPSFSVSSTDSQQPGTPPFDPIITHVHTTAASPLPLENGKGQKRVVSFMTPVHRRPKTEQALSQVPMPVSGSEREETVSNLSPSLVTGQTGTNFRSSLEVPTSPNVVVLRSQVSADSTGSTDTDSEAYITPRQSMSELESEKIFRKAAKEKTALMCKNCVAMRNTFTNSQEEIFRLRNKLKARNNKIEMLKREVEEKELECFNFKVMCDSAVSFMRELEEQVAKLKKLAYSREREVQEARSTTLAFLQTLLPHCRLNPEYGRREGKKRHQTRESAKQEDEDSLESELSDSISWGESNDSDESHVPQDHSWVPGEKVSNTLPPGFVSARTFHDISPSNSSPSHHAEKKPAPSKIKRSHKLLNMIRRFTVPSSPVQRVSSDSRPTKTQHPHHTSHGGGNYIQCPQTSLHNGKSLLLASSSCPKSLSTTKSGHNTKHDTHAESERKLKNGVPQKETGYWEEGMEGDGGSFVPEEL